MGKARGAVSALVFVSLVAYGCGGSKSGGGGGGTSVAGSTAPTASASSGAATTRPEYLQFEAEDGLQAADLLALLDQTVGAPVTGVTPAASLPIRDGLYVTATPSGSNVILRFEADGGGVRPRDAYVEVAVSQALGQTFRALVDAATATAALTAATPGLA